jgi:hypothetical protein
MRSSIIALVVLSAFAGCKGNKKKITGEAAPASATDTPPAVDTPPATDTPPAGAPCKDLRDNQGTAACETACTGGDAHACGIAGFLHLEEDPEDTADKNAAVLLQKGCDGGDGQSCNQLAVFHHSGLGGLAKDEAKMKETYAKAVPLLEKECEAGGQVSCWHAGGAYKSGLGVKADAARAKELWQKACDLGSPGACEALKKEK